MTKSGSYHCTIKKVQRSKGRSATAAAAYRSGTLIVDEKTGEIHDYRRKQGVVSADVFLPDNHPEWARDRQKLWSGAEVKNNRKNSVVARELEIALPHELSPERRQELAHEITAYIVDKYNVAADCCIHLPSTQDGADERNHHAHIMFSTHEMDADGFTTKTRIWDDKTTGPEQVEHIREKYAELENRAYQMAGIDVRVDHRSLSDQREEAFKKAVELDEKIERIEDIQPEKAKLYEQEQTVYIEQADALDRAPTRHNGPVKTAIMRKLEPMRQKFDEMAVQFNEMTDRLKIQRDQIWGNIKQELKGIADRTVGLNAEYAMNEVEARHPPESQDFKFELAQAEEAREPTAAEKLQSIRDAEVDKEAENERRRQRDRGSDLGM